LAFYHKPKRFGCFFFVLTQFIILENFTAFIDAYFHRFLLVLYRGDPTLKGFSPAKAGARFVTLTPLRSYP